MCACMNINTHITDIHMYECMHVYVYRLCECLGMYFIDIWVCGCMYVYMSIWIYAYMYVGRHVYNIYVQTWIAWMHEYMFYVCICIHDIDMHWHILFVSMYVNKHILDIHIYIYAVWIYSFRFAYMGVWIHGYMYVFRQTCTYKCAYILHVCIHTCVCIYV